MVVIGLDSVDRHWSEDHRADLVGGELERLVIFRPQWTVRGTRVRYPLRASAGLLVRREVKSHESSRAAYKHRIPVLMNRLVVIPPPKVHYAAAA